LTPFITQAVTYNANGAAPQVTVPTTTQSACTAFVDSGAGPVPVAVIPPWRTSHSPATTSQGRRRSLVARCS
jgi:hypothetical protein